MSAGLKLSAAFMLASSAAACSEYLDRRDALFSGAGDAVQTNIATQVIDPWPAHSRQVYTDSNGERLQHAMERYRSGQGESGSQAQAQPVVPVGASASPSR